MFGGPLIIFWILLCFFFLPIPFLIKKKTGCLGAIVIYIVLMILLLIVILEVAGSGGGWN
ncbi:MAG: hypothetical protein JST49_15355 [Bacteroidetes bacterium]|jgi:hypothetical protein|nr:hypothetical protein [Bacteroidota bacterium]